MFVLAVVVTALACCASGCAARFGKSATQGALNSLADGVDAAPGQRPAEAIAGRAVKGAVAELSAPEQV